MAIGAIIALLALTSLGDAANILIYPYGHCLNSHLLNAEKVAQILLRDGHNVTLLLSSAYDNYTHRQEDFPTTAQPQLLQFPSPPNYKPVCEYDTMDFMLYTPLKERFDSLISTSVTYCESLLSTTPMLKQLKATHYDLFIIESLDPCGRILADYLDVPFAPLLTAGLGHWDGNPRPPSYLPAVIAPYTSEMSFFQRMGNVLMKTAYETIPLVMGFDAPFESLKEKFQLNTSLSLTDTFDRAAIKLVNSDFAIDYPAPIEPDTVMIGGFAVDPVPPPLSDELEEFIASSGDHGVIVMSFGTLTKRFDLAWTRMFVDAFARIPQKVIWRYYSDTEGYQAIKELNARSPNKIKVMKWLPQASLLKHQKTKLFISHCGLNGMFEATHYGVPVVAVPLSGDQIQHAAKLTQHLKMGLTVDVFKKDSESVYSAISTVLNNTEYLINAKTVSDRILDQPMTVAHKVSYWVNYAIRHKGAPHLKSVAHKLTWYQYYSLDVISVIGALALACLVTLIVICYKVTKFALSSLKNVTLHYIGLKSKCE